MEKDFDYSTVPSRFTHCINSECLQAGSCLRHKVMLHVTSEPMKFKIVNPVRFPDKDECSYFFSDKKTRYALGITHLLDNLPYTKAKIIKRSIYDYFKRNNYYRILNKERLITPGEQNFIRQLFLDNGIEEEPLFDKFIEQYDW